MPNAVTPSARRSGRHSPSPWSAIRSTSSRCNTECVICESISSMPMEPGPHVEEMQAAIRMDGEAQQLLLGGDAESGAARMRAAATRYRTSWELAPPRSYGRLVGMLKAAVIAGDATEAAPYAREQVGEADSPPSHYVLAMAALVDGDDDGARAA